MNKELLLKIADVVERLPPERLNMEIWWSDDTKCGCAIGNAIYEGAIPMEFSVSGRLGCRTPIFIDEDGEEHSDIDAVERAIGLHYPDEMIFDKHPGDTPARVAQRIRDFVNAH